MSHGKTSNKAKPARAKTRVKRPARPANTTPSSPRRRETKQEAVLALLKQSKGTTIADIMKATRLAATLGPRVLCRRGAQEAWLSADVGQGRRRTHLSCDRPEATQIGVESEHSRATGCLTMAGADTRAIGRELDRIRSLDLEGLRSEWRRLYHSDPPKISRDLLVLALGYRLQEIEHGGLSKSTRRKLQTMAKALRTTGRVGSMPSLSLKPGARLVREWRGRTHTVTVAEDGFEYAGTSYPSLTKIAKKITGAHWSGPRFFGLPAAATERPNNGETGG